MSAGSRYQPESLVYSFPVIIDDHNAGAIEVGIEAIHFGQVEIMDDRDPDHAHWRDLLARVRSYASRHARRRFLLTDAHVPSGGIVNALPCARRLGI